VDLVSEENWLAGNFTVIVCFDHGFKDFPRGVVFVVTVKKEEF
jgi:hypothetical protein